MRQGGKPDWRNSGALPLLLRYKPYLDRMLNFRLKVFWAVAKHLSFRRAAEELYLSQPAVSLQIKALEEEVGLQLFDRSGSHISLTAAGGTLLQYVEKLDALAVEAESALAPFRGEVRGRLAVGASKGRESTLRL